MGLGSDSGLMGWLLDLGPGRSIWVLLLEFGSGTWVLTLDHCSLGPGSGSQGFGEVQALQRSRKNQAWILLGLLSSSEVQAESRPREARP